MKGANVSVKTNGHPGTRKELFVRVLKDSRLLLMERTSVTYDQIHAVKSLLYAALEQTKTQTDRLAEVHALLRELFTLVMMSCELNDHERRKAFTILQELDRVMGVCKGF